MALKSVRQSGFTSQQVRRVQVSHLPFASFLPKSFLPKSFQMEMSKERQFDSHEDDPFQQIQNWRKCIRRKQEEGLFSCREPS